MNDRVGSLIALIEHHRVVTFSVLILCALIVLTTAWITAANVFERFAQSNENELALAISTQQARVAPATSPSRETRATETPVPTVAPSDSRAAAPRIDMIGEPTVDVTVGESYTDDGARAFDAEGTELPIRTYVDGELTEMVVIDTSTQDTHEIEYRSTDEGGLTTTVTRTVYVR